MIIYDIDNHNYNTYSYW